MISGKNWTMAGKILLYTSFFPLLHSNYGSFFPVVRVQAESPSRATLFPRGRWPGLGRRGKERSKAAEPVIYWRTNRPGLSGKSPSVYFLGSILSSLVHGSCTLLLLLLSLSVSWWHRTWALADGHVIGFWLKLAKRLDDYRLDRYKGRTPSMDEKQEKISQPQSPCRPFVLGTWLLKRWRP